MHARLANLQHHLRGTGFLPRLLGLVDSLSLSLLVPFYVEFQVVGGAGDAGVVIAYQLFALPREFPC